MISYTNSHFQDDAQIPCKAVWNDFWVHGPKKCAMNHKGTLKPLKKTKKQLLATPFKSTLEGCTSYSVL